MKSYDVYLLYLAYKQHFESESYNAFKYNFQVSASPKSFWKRHDKYQFEKIARKYDKSAINDFFLANFVRANLGDKLWIGNCTEQTYLEWRRVREALFQHFKDDISKLALDIPKFDHLFLSKDTQHQQIIDAYLQRTINIESVIIINEILKGLIKRNVIYDSPLNAKDTILWPLLKHKLYKYSYFMVVDLKKYKDEIFKVFT